MIQPAIAGTALLTLVATLTLSACGGSSSGGDTGTVFLDQAAVDKEYTDKLATLTFPDAYPPMSSLPRPTDKTEYQQGYGTGIAERQWICSWEREWLSTQGVSKDKGRAATAFKNLEAAPQTLFMSKQLDDAGRRMYTSYLDRAKLKDPSGIQQDVDQNCKR